MRVAIVHDYIKEYGGAERVLEELLKIYPEAHIYTALYHPESLGPHRERFVKFDIRESFFKYIPFSHKLISPLRLLSPLAFHFFDLSSYDLVIVSQTGAYFPNFVTTGYAGPVTSSPPSDVLAEAAGARRGTPTRATRRNNRLIHICYTHTPPRYLYGYKTARSWEGRNVVVRIFLAIFTHVFRVLDFYSSRNVDYFIANSQEVASRIEKFYRRESEVIYPPVKIGLKIKDLRFKKRRVDEAINKTEDAEYYLAGGRLARAKGMDVIVDAFVKNGKKLKIFGRGFAGYEEQLKSQMTKGKNESKKLKVNNIEFVGEVGDEEKIELMKGARAYIFAAYDEDFGITPVEVMGQGTPVVAYRSGGVLETVIDGKTGVLYSPNTSQELNKGLERVEKMKIKVEDCRAQAKKFSEEEFGQKIKKFVNTHI